MKPNFRFSGHESFSCRYAWLPKAVESLAIDPLIFGDIDKAMVMLGLGKNMVQSLRFWIQAMRVATPGDHNSLNLTNFGRQLFADGGLDPFMEDATTLWLLHWQLCSHNENPLFAWHFLFNRYSEAEIVRSDVLNAIEREAQGLARPLSKATLAQHFDTFIHTYVATRGAKNDILEDNLDCPLVELSLIERVGHRVNRQGKIEPAYAFNREPKPDLSNGVFLYAVDDFWRRTKPDETTLSLSELTTGLGSPGQVFKLPEDDVRARLLQINDLEETYRYKESAMFEQLQRSTVVYDQSELIDYAYEMEGSNV